MTVQLLTRREALPRDAAPGELRLTEGVKMPRLKPVDLNAASTNTERMSAAILAFLGTMSVMMTTPTLVERREIDARSGRAPVPDRTRPHELVSLIDLRRDGSGREYRHRWIVRGHWRQQAYGPAHSLRRVQYVEPYIKGPEDAPLLATEKVMVWRR